MKKITLTLFALLSVFVVSSFTVVNEIIIQKRIPPDTGEDEAIQKFITDNHLNATRTSSGLYYVIEKQGDGKKVEIGKNVSVHYTGSIMNGKIFDSTTDTSFGHTDPIAFNVGEGMVIKGWDEGITFFRVGGKGKLIIPSALAYGEKGIGEIIPPNSVLVFEIEVTAVHHKVKFKPSKNSGGNGC